MLLVSIRKFFPSCKSRSATLTSLHCVDLSLLSFLQAIALLRICEDRLAEGHIPGGSHRPVEDTPKKSDKEVAEFYWFPMLAGLSELTSDPRPDVRSCALEVGNASLTAQRKRSEHLWTLLEAPFQDELVSPKDRMHCFPWDSLRPTERALRLFQGPTL